MAIPSSWRHCCARSESRAFQPTPARRSACGTSGLRQLRRRCCCACRAALPAAGPLVRAAAVLGDGASLAEAADLAGLGDDEAARAADRLVALEIVEPGERLEFAHPVVREAVYADIGPRERAAAHARAAGILAEKGASDERIAAQIVEAEPVGDPGRVELLRRVAADALVRGAPAAAAASLGRALLEPPPEASRADVLVELGSVEYSLASPEAVGHLASAVELITDPALLAAAVRWLALALTMAGDVGPGGRGHRAGDRDRRARRSRAGAVARGRAGGPRPGGEPRAASAGGAAAGAIRRASGSHARPSAWCSRAWPSSGRGRASRQPRPRRISSERSRGALARRAGGRRRRAALPAPGRPAGHGCAGRRGRVPGAGAGRRPRPGLDPGAGVRHRVPGLGVPAAGRRGACRDRRPHGARAADGPRHPPREGVRAGPARSRP